MRRRDQSRRRAAGDQGGGDDDVLLDDMAGGQLGLLGLILGRHRLGVAGGGLGRLELLVLDGDEFGPEALDLLLRGRPHVGGRDHGPQPPRRGDGLQPGHARPHDEDLGRGDRARRRHHHRKALAEGVRRLDHGAVAGQIGLGRQGVHHLRPADPRHELHGEGGHARARQRRHRLLVAIRIQQGHDHRSGLQGAGLLRRRPAHLQQNVGA